MEWNMLLVPFPFFLPSLPHSLLRAAVLGVRLGETGRSPCQEWQELLPDRKTEPGGILTPRETQERG